MWLKDSELGSLPLAPNHYWGAEWLWGAPKRPNNVTSTFFNTVNLLPKDLRFEHRGAKRASFGSVCFAPSCSAKGSFRCFSHHRGYHAFDCLCVTSLPPDVPHLGSHLHSTRRSRSEDLSSIFHDKAAIDPPTSATPCPASPPVLDQFASPLAVRPKETSDGFHTIGDVMPLTASAHAVTCTTTLLGQDAI